MGIIKQDSRLQIHRLTDTGILFTVPASEDLTNGTWVSTDLCRGEFGIQMTDDRIFVRTDNGILELSATTGTTALWSRIGGDIVAIDDLAVGLPVNILPSTASSCDLGSTVSSWRNLYLSGSIFSDNTGGQLDLDAYGTPQSVMLSNDNAGFLNEYVFMFLGGLLLGSQTGAFNSCLNLNSATASPQNTQLIASDASFSFSMFPTHNYNLIFAEQSSVQSYILNDTSSGIGLYTNNVHLEGATLQVGRFTTVQIAALTPVGGMIVYDTTLDKLQGYDASGTGSWKNLY